MTLTSDQILRILAVVLVCAAAGYAFIGSRVAMKGGRVRTESFGRAETIAALVLWTALAVRVVYGLHSLASGGELRITQAILLRAFVFHSLVLVSLVLFFRFRGRSLVEMFGLRRLPLWKVLLVAVLLTAAWFPLEIGVVNVGRRYLFPETKRQDPVEFLQDAMQHGDYGGAALLAILAVLIVPITEEVVFRGVLYPVIKRYIGIPWSALLNAALFAGMHQTPAAIPALFVLGLCLTLAYEWTGCLLVPVCMHALNNFISLSQPFWPNG